MAGNRFRDLLVALRATRSVEPKSGVAPPVVEGVRVAGRPGDLTWFEVPMTNDLLRSGRLVVRLPAPADASALVVRTPSGLRAVTNRCPHLGADLSSGALHGCVLVCPLHRWRFDLECPGGSGLDAARGRRSPKLLESWGVLEEPDRLLLSPPALRCHGMSRASASPGWT
jgi:nitrite reductase/ring-hydroxylating ferredoxin subunit